MNPQEAAARIRDVRFTTLTFRRGYNMDEVDELLDALETAALAGASPAAVVAESRLTTTRLRPGYAIAEVDAFLDEITG